MQSARHYYPISTKYGMCRQITVVLPNIKFHENPFSRSRVVTCVQTEGRSDFNRRSAGLRTQSSNSQYFNVETKHKNAAAPVVKPCGMPLVSEYPHCAWYANNPVIKREKVLNFCALHHSRSPLLPIPSWVFRGRSLFIVSKICITKAPHIRGNLFSSYLKCQWFVL
jgi:hypothetical protein